ncbi:hypothetical protein BDSB_22600 [Burkholderia dolosa PC543]|nr:hypothetical protein BDSB_22600 [Burkholderia dolosa PC543]
MTSAPFGGRDALRPNGAGFILPGLGARTLRAATMRHGCKSA